MAWLCAILENKPSPTAATWKCPTLMNDGFFTPTLTDQLKSKADKQSGANQIGIETELKRKSTPTTDPNSKNLIA